MHLRPCTIKDAKKYVGLLHRHNKVPIGGLFAVSVAESDRVVGVAIVGRPISRMLQDGTTCEVIRCCTDGTPNACSMLYGACARAAKALGYHRVVTYTLAEEPGVSLRASGWHKDAMVSAGTWNSSTRSRIQTNMFGHETRPSGPKIRWTRTLTAPTGKSSKENHSCDQS